MNRSPNSNISFSGGNIVVNELGYYQVTFGVAQTGGGGVGFGLEINGVRIFSMNGRAIATDDEIMSTSTVAVVESIPAIFTVVNSNVATTYTIGTIKGGASAYISLVKISP
ncbi:MAG: hypothetical protein A3E80_05060 [Chlamydiae bacterium RIFCSPHIGHO2_12_FULL_49_9]|nr:MAG: hypothetical protein A3E80_05060 [Chlamydiae bacterium RIFCSPHIGHO2_12_FULL_49_9]